MHIERVRVHNYKSILDSSDLDLRPGFNVILGQNNSGKTAFVEAMSLHFVNKPHRSLSTVPVEGAITETASRVEISFVLSREDIYEIVRTTFPEFLLPLPANSVLYNYNNQTEVFERVLDNVIQERNSLTCTYVGHSTNPTEGEFTSVSLMPYSFERNVLHAIRVKVDTATGALLPELGVNNVRHDDRAGVVDFQLAYLLKSRIYAFRAERPNIGVFQVGTNTTLAPDASNLPEVLENLRSNPSRFNRYQQLVSRVFPEVKQISLQLSPNRNNGDRTDAEIRIWTLEPALERQDLTHSLLESGTGIGQVLAILYIVLTSNKPRTIIIDEPQSFLHPGAVRRIFGILAEYPQHQFIITTHSPIALTSANPQTIFLVRKEENETFVETMDANEAADVRTILSDLGAKQSDVFSADQILWVEGPTEADCFPTILEQVLGTALVGTQILSMLHTDELVGRDADRVFGIYAKLSQGAAWFPPAVGFVFDREGRTPQKQADIVRMGEQHGIIVRFTQRRMYENYLLNPSAIAAVISTVDENRAEPVRYEQVNQWLEQHRWDAKYMGQVYDVGAQNVDVWLREVHGANLLNDIFTVLTEIRVPYDKREHGLALTTWIVANSRADLTEIAQILRDLLQIPNRGGVPVQVANDPALQDRG